jgi:hypothetical protein
MDASDHLRTVSALLDLDEFEAVDLQQDRRGKQNVIGVIPKAAAGLCLMGEQQRVSPAKVGAQVAFEPDDDLIGLLQCGLQRRFDKIKDYLMSVVEKGMKKIGERKAAAPTATAAAAPAAPVESLAGISPADAAGASACDGTKRPGSTSSTGASWSGTSDDSAESLLEALSEIAPAEDDLI